MTAFLHIGIGKTGTTSIQSTLAQNRQHLIAQGYLYPDAGRMGDSHYGFFDVDTQTIDEAAFEALAVELGSVKSPHVLMSSESFIYAPIEVVARLNSLLGGSARVIVYVREQVSLIVSSFLQYVKVGQDYLGSVEAFLEKHEDSFDYVKLIRPWADQFGDDSIEAHFFHPDVVGKSVAQHFFGLIGLQGIDGSNAHYNSSLLPEFFPLVKAIDEIGVDRELRQQIIAHLLVASDGLRGSSTHDVLHTELKRRIRATYAASNNEFALNYLPESERSFLMNLSQ